MSTEGRAGKGREGEERTCEGHVTSDSGGNIVDGSVTRAAFVGSAASVLRRIVYSGVTGSGGEDGGGHGGGEGGSEGGKCGGGLGVGDGGGKGVGKPGGTAGGGFGDG